MVVGPGALVQAWPTHDFLWALVQNHVPALRAQHAGPGILGQECGPLFLIGPGSGRVAMTANR